PMRRLLLIVVLIQAALVTGFLVALGSGRFPLGVPGEWEWTRLQVAPTLLDWMTALLGITLYAGVIGQGSRVLSRKASRGREGVLVSILIVASVAVQATVQSGAPQGYGLTKWVTLAMPGSSGYDTVAKREARDPWRFWAAYPDWIKTQDALHIGTHPPGLFLTAKASRTLMESQPELARFVVAHLPETVLVGFREILGPLSTTDKATLAWIGAWTLLACSATVAPLYCLARGSGLSSSAAWASAALWPLVPSTILFQPTADTAFPLLSTTALALAVPGKPWAAVLAGVTLALGMQFTLAFLPVGLIAALMLLSLPGTPWRRRLLLVWATGLGFLGFTLVVWTVSGADPFLIWWWNQKNHAQFYLEFPRTYRAWVIANPVELAVALGLPIVVWAGSGLKQAPRAAWATLAVLAVLNFSGRNLSEVARLWLPLMPPLLTLAGAGLCRLGGGGRTLAATAGLLGLQTVALQALIQVVYPV
ncbi:MAG: hypothetical protein ABI353_07500, partial [Isosphaeraceae bacterium]